MDVHIRICRPPFQPHQFAVGLVFPYHPGVCPRIVDAYIQFDGSCRAGECHSDRQMTGLAPHTARLRILQDDPTSAHKNK